MKRMNLGGYPFRLRLHLLPVLVWLGALVCVIALFSRRTQRFEVIGIARGQVRQVAATSTARLKSLHVELFEQVEAGQVLAVVDTVLDNEQLLEAELDTQLAAALAEIEHLTAQLVPAQEILLAEQADREANQIAQTRRFLVDTEQARLQILQLRAQIASDQIVLKDLAVEMKITEDLLGKEAVAPLELEKIKAQHDSLAEKIRKYEDMLKQAEEDLKRAQQRLDDFAQRELMHPSVDGALEVIRKEIRVQEGLMRGLLEQLEALGSRRAIELKAPFDGVVIPIQGQANQTILRRPGEDLMRRPGEVVRAGDAVLAVAELKPSEIVVYVSENQLALVRENTTVEVVKSRTPPQKARCEVAYVGPTVELMPERLWQNPGVPQWGRPVVIRIPERLELVCGELVGVRTL
jgi:multidrug efflux pump subunit AcrA (membrane-fusion protein)